MEPSEVTWRGLLQSRVGLTSVQRNATRVHGVIYSIDAQHARATFRLWEPNYRTAREKAVSCHAHHIGTAAAACRIHPRKLETKLGGEPGKGSNELSMEVQPIHHMYRVGHKTDHFKKCITPVYTMTQLVVR